MFSGIVEEAAPIVALKRDNGNLHLTLKSSFAHELKIDQSVAHNGVCLTVVNIEGDHYTVTAIQETLERSNLGTLSVGDKVNLERSMLMNGRLDGHIVQGHVDQTARCTKIDLVDGSRYYTFTYDLNPEMAAKGYMTVEKGSVTVNGVSLTVCNSQDNSFQVAIIPYTYEHTNFHQIEEGSIVNLEFDIIGKYISRIMHFEKIRTKWISTKLSTTGKATASTIPNVRSNPKNTAYSRSRPYSTLGLQCATVALHRSGRTRVAKPSGRCRGQPHIGHEPLHQTSSRAYPCRGGATQFHIGHRRTHQGQTISAARHRYRCRTHHPRRHCRRIGQLHTRLVRRESHA